MQVAVPVTNMWGKLFIVIMQVGVSVTVMQMIYSAVHFAHDCFYCNYTGDCFCYSYIDDSFKQQLYIPFSN